MERSGNFSSSCANCNVTWSHVDETPYSTTYVTGYHSSVFNSVSALFTPRWDDLYLTCSGCNAGSGTTVVPGQLALSEFERACCRLSHLRAHHLTSCDPDKVLVNNDGTIGCFNANGSTQLAQPTFEGAPAPQTPFATPTGTSDGPDGMATPWW